MVEVQLDQEVFVCEGLYLVKKNWNIFKLE